MSDRTHSTSARESRHDEALVQRFMAKVDKGGPGGCWLWTAGRARNGYARFAVNRVDKMAHRVSYEFFVGPIPERYTIDHVCHVIHCVNPDHLQAVPQYINSQNRRGAASNSATGVRGVSWKASRNAFVVTLAIRGKQHWGGCYSSLDEAEAAAIALRNRLMTNNLADRR